MPVLYSSSNRFVLCIKEGIESVDTIKEKVEKLLRLAMSDNPHEAKLAADRAIALMKKYAIKQEEVGIDKIVSQAFYLDYARIPIWIRELYSGLSYVNGCYMVWVDGHRNVWGETLEKKAKIILTGRESDVLNTEYFLHIFIREIEKRSLLYSKEIGKCPHKRARLRTYRIGLGKGLISRISEAMDRYESHEGSLNSSNLPVYKDDRYEQSKDFYLDRNQVRSVKTHIKKDAEYYFGMMEAKKVDLHRPIRPEGEVPQLLEW